MRCTDQQLEHLFIKKKKKYHLFIFSYAAHTNLWYDEGLRVAQEGHMTSPNQPEPH